jgi:hypothetical protein
MAVKNFDDNPKSTDTIVFDFECPGADGCFTDDPYKVDKLVIYHVQRDFSGGNYGEYEDVRYDATLAADVREADAAACADPSNANLLAASQLRAELESKSQRNTYYFRDAVAVHTVGEVLNPAWLSSEPDDALIEHIDEDEDGNTQYGRFRFTWIPSGRIREGDYFLCWTWTPFPAGDTLSSNIPFVLYGDQRAVTTTPAHHTPDGKYEILLERYLPELYKMRLTDNDLSPEQIDKLNRSVAKGFTVLEDFVTQIIDLYDANSLHESLLVYLGNLFNLRLKSDDPQLWRRQIKLAVATFKQKGTLAGLEEAFSQSGMTLSKFTQLWQTSPRYTWTESFKVADSAVFKLSRNALTPIDDDNFGLWLRREGEDEYEAISSDCILFEDAECGLSSTMTWIGDELSANSIKLFSGDYLKVMYKTATVPSGEQSVENYIRTLPLADLRDETAQDYPKKNWNTRVIEADDPMFDVVVPVRHPFHDDVIFGKVRTEFPYSENIYNMEEYNGSVRESTRPCDIDKDFIDPCSSGLSSKYLVDVAVENLSDERIQEVLDILREYTPFHAVPHQINLSGEVNEFVQSPVETIESLVTVQHTEYVLAGGANPLFHRVMEDGNGPGALTRSDLAQEVVMVSNKLGTGYNDHVVIIAPDADFKSLGVIRDGHVLEVLSPSANAGEYTIRNWEHTKAQIRENVMEPLSTSMFTFNLYNILYDTAAATITQKNRVELTDDDVDFAALGVKSLWDDANTEDYSGDPWKVRIGSTDYEVADVVDGVLILSDPSRTLPTTDTTTPYLLLDDTDEEIASSTGDLTVTKRGLVNFNDTAIVDIKEYVRPGITTLVYDGIEYLIPAIESQNFYIEDYEDGDASTVSVELRKNLLDQSIGYFAYEGIKLQTDSDHEVEFEIVNGANPPSTDDDDILDDNRFKENFLIKIDGNYYRMAEIDASTITLSGLTEDWMTLNAGGTSVRYDIVRLVKTAVEIDGVVLDQIDRDGMTPVSSETETAESLMLSAQSAGGPQDVVRHVENISYTITYRSGEQTSGTLQGE